MQGLPRLIGDLRQQQSAVDAPTQRHTEDIA
jgi:hypothetical protein